ncbi:MAG: hypothetical protein ACU83V_08655 [Gammaproteobacteria bacterium]
MARSTFSAHKTVFEASARLTLRFSGLIVLLFVVLWRPACLTTFCSFTSLAFNAHVGTASMGLLLAVGITLTIVCNLLVLPALAFKK